MMYRRMGPKELERVIEGVKLQKAMEDMANQPKEEMGKRQPGEVNMYELSQIPINYRAGYRQAVKEGKTTEFLKTVQFDRPLLVDRP